LDRESKHQYRIVREEKTQIEGVTTMPINAGIIIAQRRPILSAIVPQTQLDTNVIAFARATGRATKPGPKCRSFCRWIGNNPNTV
jgi:hypothetical protein